MTGLLTYLAVDLPLLLAQVGEETSSGDEVWGGWGSVIFVTGILVLVTVIIIAGLWFVRGIQVAKADAARDEEYRKLAEQAATLQEQLLEQQQVVAADLADVKGNVERIEQILREVE